MRESIAPSGAPTVPAYLLELPESVVEAPPVEPRIPKLPFDQLSWQDFERLVFRLARKNHDAVYCAPYGRSGQAQDGIDVYARLSGGGHVCWQARNRKDVSASDIEKSVDDFLKGKWAASAERFVLCVRASLADTKLQDTIEAQAARLREEGIVFEGIDGTQLSEKLRPHPEIVDDFFGRSWLVAFAGEDAAASLKRPLEVQRVIALRSRLAEIYNARSQQLDPGLNVDPARRDTRDIRKRFVVPHVDPANPFLVPSLEPGTDRPRRVGRMTIPGSSTSTATPGNPPTSVDRRASRPRRLPLRSTTGCCRASVRCCSRAHPARARVRLCGASPSTWCAHRNCSPRSVTGLVHAYRCSSLLHSGAVSRRRNNAKWGWRR